MANSSVDCRLPKLRRAGLVIAATPRHSAQTIAFNEVGRQAIRGDEAWNQGDYGGDKGPFHGLGVARMMAHITYLSDLGMEEKFRQTPDCKQNEDLTKVVNGYLEYQAQKFIDRFDAKITTYLKLTSALDRFDLFGKHGLDDTLERPNGPKPHPWGNANSSGKLRRAGISAIGNEVIRQVKINGLWNLCQRLGKEASYLEMPDTHGHDSFLKGSDDFDRAVRVFFSGMDKKEEEEQNLGRFRQVSSRYEVKKEADFKVIDDWVFLRTTRLGSGMWAGYVIGILARFKASAGLGSGLRSLQGNLLHRTRCFRLSARYSSRLGQPA